MFYDVLERQNAFLGYRKKKLKKLKNWDFSKGVSPWFAQKLVSFSCSYSSLYRQGKCVLRCRRTKDRLLIV